MTDNKISIRIEDEKRHPVLEKTVETTQTDLMIQLHMFSKETGTVSKYIIIRFPPTKNDLVINLYDEWKKIC